MADALLIVHLTLRGVTVKKVLLVLILLAGSLIPLTSQAQLATVTATVTDSDGTAWANGTYKIQFYPNPAYPNFGSYNINGVPLTTYGTLFQGALSGTGAFSQAVPNTSLITPGGSAYVLTICPNATTPCSVLAPIALTGGSISSYVSANVAPVRFPATGANSYGYSDTEVYPVPVQGAIFFNVTSLVTEQWNGSIWQTLGGGGGCTGATCVVKNPTLTQTVAQPAGTTLQSNVLSNEYWANLWGTGSNGIETAYGTSGNCITQSATSSTGCIIMVPPFYTIADNPSGWGAGDVFAENYNGSQMPSGAAAEDVRNGVFFFDAHNPGSTAPLQQATMSVRADEDSTAKVRYSFTNAGSQAALNIAENIYAGGFNFQNYFNIPGYSFGNFYYGLTLKTNNWTSGQLFGQVEIVNQHGVGDAFLHYEQMNCDGGMNTSDDEGCTALDQFVSEDATVFTGTIGSGGTTGSTTIFVNASIGGGTQGADRLLVDTSQVAFSNTKWTSNANSSNGFPVIAADTTQTFPVSTMVSLCYAGSDNGAGGAAGCTAGNVPSGYIPPNSASATLHAPAATIVTGVDASYTGLPSGFCTSANLQSSSSGSACYMPASGAGCLTSPEEYESVSYTYNSSTQQVTLLNLQYPHSNKGLTFATGGLCGYAVEDVANSYTGGGTTGVIDPVYPIEGTVDSHTIYYITQRTNFGYGVALLGGSTDGGSGNGTGVTAPSNYAQLCFTTTSSSWSNAGGTVTFSMAAPAGTINTFITYNNLLVTISATGNSTYEGNYRLSFVRDNVFTYTPTAPTGSVPTSGTISYCNASYKIEPSARVLDVYNTTNNKIDGTFHLMPNLAPFITGDTVKEPHYQQMLIKGQQQIATQFQPAQYVGGQTNNWTFQGNVSGPTWGLFVTNSANQTNYKEYGGAQALPNATLTINGPWYDNFNLTQPPVDALLNVSGCKLIIGCSNRLSNFLIFRGPALTTQNPVPGVNSEDTLDYDPNYMASTRYLGTHTGIVRFGQSGGAIGDPTEISSLTTLEIGYVIADQSVTAPTVTTSNLFTTQQTTINVFYGTAGTPGSTNYNYWVVGHALAGGTTVPIGGTVINTGNATLSSSNYNVICIPFQAGWASYDILRTSTTTSIVTGLSATVPNGSTLTPVQPGNYSCFYDQGGSTTAYVAPTVNTTGGANIAGPIVNKGIFFPAVANVQLAMPTATILAGQCNPNSPTALSTVSMPGLLATSTITYSFGSDPRTVSGYGASAGLNFVTVPGADVLSYALCNPTATSITPGAMTLNVGAK